MKPRDPEKELALFEATLKLAEHGNLTDLTIQQIASEAGLSVGTVYVYFEGKEDLFRRLYWRSKRNATERMVQGYRAELPFRQGFRLVCRNYFDFLLSERRDVTFQEKFLRSGPLDPATLELTKASAQPIEELMARGQAEDLVKPWNRVSLLRFVMVVVKEGAIQAQQLEPNEREACFERTLQFCWDGVAH